MYNIRERKMNDIDKHNLPSHIANRVEELESMMDNFEMNPDVKRFSDIAYELTRLYEKKNAAYGNSFGDTYKKLGIISAVTRLSDKYNRLCNLVTKPYIDDIGESLEDTLKDLAAYSIMTIMEMRQSKADILNI